MIRSSKTKIHGIKGDPTTPRPLKPPSQRINKQIDIIEHQKQEIEILEKENENLRKQLSMLFPIIEKQMYMEEIQSLKNRIKYLENELRNCGYSDTDLDNDFLWKFQDKQIGWEE